MPGCSTTPGRTSGDGGEVLCGLHSVDLNALRELMAGIKVTVACDVDNPLTGPTGAAAVYGPQKGADPGQVRELDTALGHWADEVAAATGHDHREDPGAGAAGGIGFAALALLDAELRPGIDLVLDLVGFHDRIQGSDLVVTGEGALDVQTLHGKAPAGVAAAARALGIPVVAVCGRNTLAPGELRDAGIQAAYALIDVEPDLDRCMSEGAALLESLGETIAAGPSWRPRPPAKPAPPFPASRQEATLEHPVGPGRPCPASRYSRRRGAPGSRSQGRIHRGGGAARRRGQRRAGA